MSDTVPPLLSMLPCLLGWGKSSAGAGMGRGQGCPLEGRQSRQRILIQLKRVGSFVLTEGWGCGAW